MSTPSRTILFDTHVRLGARMTAFAGFEMPLSYSGIIQEHLAVRRAAGLFDLSHMGEFEISGPHALDLLERALTNHAGRLAVNHAQYSVMCGEDGGTIDDLLVYRLGPQRYLLCVNASNVRSDYQWLSELNDGRAVMDDLSNETALIGVQGPATAEILGRVADFAVDSVSRFALAEGRLAGAACLAARTGYTGEDGFELFVAAKDAPALFEALLESGSPLGLKPCGLGARDTLRMEAGFPLYGHELDRTTSPIEAGLGSFVKFDHDFVGDAALLEQVRRGTRRHLVGLMTEDGRSVARPGYKLYRGDVQVGIVTSGTLAPSFKRPLAMAWLTGPAPADKRDQGRDIEVEIRRRRVPARIVKLPFYRRGARMAA